MSCTLYIAEDANYSFFLHKAVVIYLPKGHMALVSATCIKFEVSYSKKFSRYEKMNAIYSLGMDANSSVSA